MKLFSVSFTLQVMTALFGCTVVSGCLSKVYDDQDSWLVCENARPLYFAAYDVFYLAPERYDGHGEFPYVEHAQAQHEVAVPFGIHTRVFAPIYRGAADAERALDYYLARFHGGNGRPFIFLGEGEGARILADIAREHGGGLRRKGYLGGWYSPETCRGFVTDALVSDVNETVRQAMFERSWGRRE